MGWRDRMKEMAERRSPSATMQRAAAASIDRDDRRNDLAFEFELIREQGRPLDY